MAKKNKTPNLYDELNFARFGVISMHTRVDQSITHWNTEFAVNGRTFRIEAVTPQGRPHGIDTDTLVALETLFIAHDCPQGLWQVVGHKEAEGPQEGRQPEVQIACHTVSCHVLKAVCW
ncbi:hypothetical protein [Deinococcus arcticus]|uniref:hypothetical protein n=1 Tax=Deinococcus arcticus TaxID=2136176 RepID=UPI001E3EEEF8|nr:hypothetical protein [Deinococcus arcticus]